MKPLYFGLAAVGVALIVLYVVWSRGKKRRREQEEMFQLTYRNDALNEALRDPMAKDTDGPRGVSQAPLEISWDEKAIRQSTPSAASVMIELVELSEYSRRKYVFRANRPITIGSGPDNLLVLPREGVADRHCAICLAGKRPCVRTLANARTILKRNKTAVLVSAEGIYLNNGDHIQIGKAEIRFRAFKA